MRYLDFFAIFFILSSSSGNGVSYAARKTIAATITFWQREVQSSLVRVAPQNLVLKRGVPRAHPLPNVALLYVALPYVALVSDEQKKRGS